MGNATGKLPSLPERTVARLKRHTGFDEGQINALYAHFLSLARKGEGDKSEEVISKRAFQRALGLSSSSLFVERCFAQFDSNGDGFINATEFITAMAVLGEHSAYSERLKFAFAIMDIDEDEKLSKKDVRTMLSASFTENEIEVSPAGVQTIVDRTFDAHDLDKDGFLSWEEYTEMAEKKPDFLKPLTLHVKTIIKERLDEYKSKKSTA